MNQTGIEWADKTWNPIVGCTHGCTFCYARRMAKRFKRGVHFRADGSADHYGCQDCYDFRPHLHPEWLGQPAAVQGGRIVFCGSMGDMFDANVQPEWRHQVWAAMNDAWCHHYVVLSKRPDLVDAEELAQLYRGPMNGDLNGGGFWLGVSVTCDDDWWRVERLVEIKHQSWGIGAIISFEPLLGPIEHDIPREIGWVIIGAQTGTGAIAPEPVWVGDIWLSARPWAPVFEKDNLASVMPHKLPQQWPEAMEMETRGVVRRAGLQTRRRPMNGNGGASEEAPSGRPTGDGDGGGGAR